MRKTSDLEFYFPEGGRNFNGAIEERGTSTYLAYRHENNSNPIIKIGEVKSYRNVEGNKINIPHPTPHAKFFEDPRLFWHKDRLWMSFIAAGLVDGLHYACQGICRLNAEFQPDRIFYPDAGKNRNHISTGNGKLTREKNWTFFPFRGKIWVLYTINPLKVGVMDEETGEIQFQTLSKFKSEWPHGEIHGSTPPIERNGKLWGCFHSFIKKDQRQYHCGFYEIDPAKWVVTRISENAWLSAEPDEALDLRPFSQSYRPNVVFPCGMIEKNGKVWITYGWQDCRCLLAKLSHPMVELSMSPVKESISQSEYIKNPLVIIPGIYDCTIRGIKFQCRNWLDLIRETKKYNIPEQDVHGALCPRISSHLKELRWPSPLNTQPSITRPENQSLLRKRLPV